MKLENQVCTFNQAIKLSKLLGKYAPESLWGWTTFGRKKNNKYFLIRGSHIEDTQSEYYPAYTGDESGVLLPPRLILEEKESYLNIWKSGKYFMCAYRNTENDFPVSEHFRARYEAHAKAALLIHLLEQKLIDPKDLKL